MSDDAGIDYVAAFRARWPEWALALPFVPVAQRDVAEHWFALLQVLTDAAWGGSDPTPGLAKLAWWQEELAGWSRGARRHPLGDLLQKQVAPWRELGLALRALPATRGRPGEAGNDEAMAGFPQAVADVERALFAEDGGGGGPAGEGSGAVARSLAIEHRIAHEATAAGDAIGAMHAADEARATRPRRIHLALQRARRDAMPSPPLRSLWTAWRAARAG